LREISKNAEGLSERKTAILAAFDIASDYFQILKERDNLAKNIERRARALNHQIESLVALDEIFTIQESNSDGLIQI
jgi:cell division protein ZapA